MSDRRPKAIPASRRGGGAREAWWYEDHRGIEVFVEKQPDLFSTVSSVRIPWGQLLRAAQRSSGKEVVVSEKAKTTKRTKR